MRRLLKWLLGLALSLVALVLLCVALLAFTLGTESGTRWALERIDAQISASITVENLSGSLWRGILADEIVYLDSARSVRAQHIGLDFDWVSVFAGTVIVESLEAESVTYQRLVPPDPVAKPFQLSMPPLPFTLAVHAGRVGVFNLQLGSNELAFRNIVVERADIDANRLRARSLQTDAFGMGISVAMLDTTLEGDVPLSADVEWSSHSGDWSGRGKVEGSLARLEFEQTVAGRLPASVFGSISIVDRLSPFYEATVRWQRWSFADVGIVDGDARVSGLLNDYEVVYDVGLQLPGRELAQLQGSAKGNLRSLTEFAAELSSPAGLATASGRLTWLPEFSADGSVLLTDVDLSALETGFSGQIGGQADIAMEGIASIRAANARLSGMVNDTPVEFSGAAEKTGQRFACAKCELIAGTNRVAADGFYDDGNFDMDFSVDAPATGELWSGIAGALNGHGRLHGSVDTPFFVGELTGQSLRLAGWSAEYIAIDSRESGPRALDLSAELRSLFRGDADFGSGTVTASGPLSEIAVELDWLLRGIEIDTSATLDVDETSLSGSINRASLLEPNSGQWRLQEPFRFSLQEGALTVGQHQWLADIGNLSIGTLTRTSDEFRFNAELANVPLQAANRFLPPGFALQGSATADIDLSLAAGEWQGTINWRQTDSVVQVTEMLDVTNDIRIPHFSASATLADGGAQATASIEIEPGVTGDLELTLETLSMDAPVTAELHARGADWSWISAAIPAVDDFRGLVEADIHASGPLRSPDFSGNLTWRDGALAIPALNIPLSNIEVVVSGASDGSATVNGSATAGAGQLKLSGRLVNVMAAERSIELQLTGDTAELINWPEYRLWLSPDVTVTDSVDGWQINGDVAVPRAEIALRELPVEAVERSSDVVVVGEDPAPENPMRYSGEIQFKFGDRVHVTAFGLDTRLTGDLMLRTTIDRPPQAEGRVDLEDGVFEAYGQKLTIEEGSLTFTGPLDNPLVDVKAVRVIESFEGKITAGLHLRGRAQNITSTVYSDPVMNEADALSYVMLGRPLTQISETEGSNVSGAAISLGLRQATQITEEIGQSIGLDQLSLTGDGGDSTALIAGKQLNSRVYARYAYGVFSRLGSLLLRYRLSERLSLEAGAGETQSIDILYTVEKQ
jgi:translocation and assembly module TamB